MALLSPYRVLDLSDERGLLCGQMLADMGADVISVEPVGGSSARMIPPFAGDQPHRDRSLFWWAYSRNKRGITLDIAASEGRELLKKLVARADFLIESFEPGHLAKLDLGYETLSRLNPKLIFVSISAFGQDGPKSHYADADLIVMAAGGPLVLAGDDDRPPVRVSVPQAYLHASADAAVAVLAAHHERVRSGLGQWIDVAAIQSVAMATQSYVLAAPLGSPEARRMSGGVKIGPLSIPLVWPARDGHIALTFLFGSALGVFTQKLMRYVCERGFCDEATRDKDWIQYGELLGSGAEPLSEFERVKDVVAKFTASHTKAELLQMAVERGFLMTPVATVEEVVNSPQLAARRYWHEIEHPELGRAVRYPGPFAKFAATPIEYRLRPPTVGEHNAEILGELGVGAERLQKLAREGVV